MRKMLMLILVSFTVFAFAGCAAVSSPVSNGVLYTGVKGPVTATQADTYSKVGEASCSSFLGIVSSGDASITAAMENGGLDDIHHVDHKSTSVLGVYSQYTTIVYGE